MNQTWIKVVVIIGFIILIVSLLFVIKLQRDSAEENRQLKQDIIEMKQFQDETIRSESKFVSEQDLKSLADKQNVDLKMIQDDMKPFHAEVKAIDVVVISTPGKAVESISSTKVVENANPQPPSNLDLYHYLINKQILELSEPIGKISIPFGNIGFSAWQKDPWNYSIYPRKYVLNTVIGQDENGRDYTYHKITIETKGKSFDVPITEAKLSQLTNKSKLFFNPRLGIGIAGGISIKQNPEPEITPFVDISLASYGPTRTNSEWTFGSIGIGYQSIAKEVNLIVSPARYNVGYKLPLIDNLNIGPSVSANIKGEFAVYLSINAGL